MDYTNEPVLKTKEEVQEMIEQYGCGGACGYMGCGHELTQMELAHAYAYILYAKEVIPNA